MTNYHNILKNLLIEGLYLCSSDVIFFVIAYTLHYFGVYSYEIHEPILIK